MKKESDFITDREFNRLWKKKRLSTPGSDSEGDTGDDEAAEATLGKDYGGREDDDVLADTPAEESEGGEESLSNDVGVQSSTRPDPRNDLDKAI